MPQRPCRSVLLVCRTHPAGDGVRRQGRGLLTAATPRTRPRRRRRPRQKVILCGLEREPKWTASSRDCYQRPAATASRVHDDDPGPIDARFVVDEPEKASLVTGSARKTRQREIPAELGGVSNGRYGRHRDRDNGGNKFINGESGLLHRGAAPQPHTVLPNPPRSRGELRGVREGGGGARARTVNPYEPIAEDIRGVIRYISGGKDSAARARAWAMKASWPARWDGTRVSAAVVLQDGEAGPRSRSRCAATEYTSATVVPRSSKRRDAHERDGGVRAASGPSNGPSKGLLITASGPWGDRRDGLAARGHRRGDSNASLAEVPRRLRSRLNPPTRH